MAPVALNIVCFRLRAPGLDQPALDRLNAETGWIHVSSATLS
jgi:hypothetical protein